MIKGSIMSRKKKNNTSIILTLIVIVLVAIYYNFESEIKEFIYSYAYPKVSYNLGDIPEYSEEGFVYINDNEPFFKEEEINTNSYEKYSDLDILGRAGVAIANISKELMPTKERESIGMIKPSGWHTVRYDGIVEGNYLYNRCHLIGYQLTGENANPQNLITCTRQVNNGIMKKYEDMVADYLKDTNNHVLYRVTPIYEDTNLVASGIEMEALSVEDNGKRIKFNIYIYNIQDQIEIDYKTGDSKLKDS